MRLAAKLRTFGAIGFLTFGGAALAQDQPGGQQEAQVQPVPAEAMSFERLQMALTNLPREIIELETLVLEERLAAEQIQLVSIAQVSQAQAQPAEQAAGAEAQRAQAQTVQVSLVDFAIEMPASLPAGTVTFEVTNNGTHEHNFEIEGQGIEEVFDQNLQPGETMTMTVDLEPGSYEVYCPVGNHREMGMELELTVTEARQQEGQAGQAEDEQAAGDQVERAQAMDVDTLIGQNQQAIDQLRALLQNNTAIEQALQQQNIGLANVVAVDVMETGEVLVYYLEQPARMQEQQPQDQPQNQPQDEPQDQPQGGDGGQDGGSY